MQAEVVEPTQRKQLKNEKIKNKGKIDNSK